jgi:hypothetical protein
LKIRLILPSSISSFRKSKIGTSTLCCGPHMKGTGLFLLERTKNIFLFSSIRGHESRGPNCEQRLHFED